MAAAAAMPSIPKELIDQFVTGPMSAEAVNAASMAFKKALIERALGAELSHHLGYRPGGTEPEDANNHRNGASGKTLLTEDGPLRIDVPRDREGSFEPVLIPKHERRFTGFDDKIVAMYARGMTVREIQGFLAEQYGTEVAPDFILGGGGKALPWNVAWSGQPVSTPAEGGGVELTGPGLPKVTLLSPTPDRLADLYKVWAKELERLRRKESDRAEPEPATTRGELPSIEALAARVTPTDKAVPNGSSIAMLLEHQGARCCSARMPSRPCWCRRWLHWPGAAASPDPCPSTR